MSTWLCLLADKRPLWDVLQCPNSPTHVLGSEDLKPGPGNTRIRAICSQSLQEAQGTELVKMFMRWMNCQEAERIGTIIPKSILYHTIPARPPARTGVVALKEVGWVISGKLRKQTSLLTKDIQFRFQVVLQFWF